MNQSPERPPAAETMPAPVLGRAPRAIHDLTGKVAIVTGAARGQGEAEARLFVELGARVGEAAHADQGLEVPEAGEERGGRVGRGGGAREALIDGLGVGVLAEVEQEPAERDRGLDVGRRELDRLAEALLGADGVAISGRVAWHCY